MSSKFKSSLSRHSFSLSNSSLKQQSSHHDEPLRLDLRELTQETSSSTLQKSKFRIEPVDVSYDEELFHVHHYCQRSPTAAAPVYIPQRMLPPAFG